MSKNVSKEEFEVKTWLRLAELCDVSMLQKKEMFMNRAVQAIECIHEKSGKSVSSDVGNCLTEVSEVVQKGEEFKYMTVSEFISLHDSLKKYSAESVGKALSWLGIRQISKKINGSVIRIRELPSMCKGDR